MSQLFDAESAVLASMMAAPESYWRIADKLTPDDFAHGPHKRLFGVVSSLIRDESAADAVTVGELHPDLAAEAIDIATGTASRAANIVSYAEIVARSAMQRRVVNAGQRIAQLSGPEAYAEAQRILADCQPRTTSRIVTLKDAMRDWFHKTSQQAMSDQAMTGVPTSLDWLDEQTGGWQPDDLIIIAARPSVGKTTLALQCALHAAKHEHAVLVFSAEMSATQLADRAVSSLGHVSTHALRRPKAMHDGDWARVTVGVTQGSPLPVWIDDSSGITAVDVAARARQINAERRLSLIVIDYLGLMKHPKADRHDLAVGMTTAALKGLAKQMHVPIVLVSQLKRAGNDEPKLDHLRDSGSIEQDADAVVFLHRPDEANRESVKLILAKQRQGPTGSMWLEGNYSHLTFSPGEEPPKAETQGRGRGFRAGRTGSRLAAVNDTWGK